MWEKLGGRLVVVFYVFAAYFFFANHSNVAFMPSLDIVPQSHYHYLTQGFLWKQLHLSIFPPELLLSMQNPYDPIQNYFTKYGDAVLYAGKYYLYFGPLPVLIFYLPMKILTGYYFSDTLAVLVFLFLGFLIQFALLIKIKNKYFNHLSEGWLIFSGFVLAFANNAPFMLAADTEGVYRSAIAAAFLVMSIGFYYLYNVFNQCKTRDVWLFSLFVSLTVACRPHFILISILLIVIVLIYLIKYVPKQRIAHYIIALCIPAVTILSSLAAYNFIRFHSIWEFGQHFQLSGYDATKTSLLNLKTAPTLFLKSLYNYLLHPLSLVQQFPYFKIQTEQGFAVLPDPEPIAGIILITPIVIFSLIVWICSKYQRVYFQSTQRPLLWFLLSLLCATGVIFVFLTSLAGVTQRYITDFLPYLLFFTLVLSLFLMDNLKNRNLAKVLFLTLGVISIMTGSALGMRTPLRAVKFTPINDFSLSLSLSAAPIVDSKLNQEIFSQYIKICLPKEAILLLF